MDSFQHDCRHLPEISQKLQMLSSVLINCQVTKIAMNPGSQLFDQKRILGDLSKKVTGLFWNFSQIDPPLIGDFGSNFENFLLVIAVILCWFWGPMQLGSPPQCWRKFPNNPVFFFERPPYFRYILLNPVDKPNIDGQTPVKTASK